MKTLKTRIGHNRLWPTVPGGAYLRAALPFCYLLLSEQLAAGANFAAIQHELSLPPLSIEPGTNALRLRFNGNPAQRFMIQQAPAIAGPWNTITTRSTPSGSTLLRYDVTNRSSLESFYRIVQTNSGKVMTGQEFVSLPRKAADFLFQYGDQPQQQAELRIPTSQGPYPVVILLHGGCFKSTFANLRSLGPAADALKMSGIASWNIEYRRLGEPGAGWPGTYLDVGRAVDYLRTIAAQYRLDLNRVVVMGHSAGGDLAMWVAARSRLPTESPIYVADPLTVKGVVNLAGTGDMAAFLPFQSLCGGAVIEELLGGTPAQFPERYAQASAIKMLPMGIPQILVRGQLDDVLPLSIAKNYIEAAKQAGDPVLLLEFPDHGHHEIGSPLSPCWPVVRSAIESLLKTG